MSGTRSAAAGTVALPSVDYYSPRDPAADVPHRVARDHLQTFLAEAQHLRDGEGVPRLVEQAFLRCGWRAGGFARFRCGDCGVERLDALSCKGCGFCPSCRGRRMTERAAHLVDHVIPDVPIRQWVLTLVEASAVARRILQYLSLPADLPRPALARAPPIGDGDE